MIISASRRTDIPALYADWFINRVRAGVCTVPNPFNPGQVTQVSLRPEDVDVIVFWTRFPRPLLPYLNELDGRGYRYYVQVTVLDYPHLLHPRVPPFDAVGRACRELAARIGPERVIWRYDPIMLSSLTDAAYHRRAFERVAGALCVATRRCVVSLADPYRKTARRLQMLAAQGVALYDTEAATEAMEMLMPDLVSIATGHGIEMVSCAETVDLQRFGVRPGKCIDDDLIRRLFGIAVDGRKDPAQRAACGCVVSKDIGMYDSCTFGCVYCYATSDFERAQRNRARHDPTAMSLLPVSEACHGSSDHGAQRTRELGGRVEME